MFPVTLSKNPLQAERVAQVTTAQVTGQAQATAQVTGQVQERMLMLTNKCWLRPGHPVKIFHKFRCEVSGASLIVCKKRKALAAVIR